MSLPSDYASILNDLNRDVVRHRPLDPLQFCADWFNNRLREDRRIATATTSGLSPVAGAPAALPQTGSPRMGRTAGGSPYKGSTPLPHVSTAPAAAAASSDASPFAANANPFAPAFSFEGPSRNNSLEGSDTADSSDTHASSFAPPVNYNLGRRTSVSAESMQPTSPVSTPTSADTPAKKTIPKTESQLQRIRASFKDNLLFRNLDEEQERDVLMAMEEVHCEPNTIVIRQGDQGDFFYVVERGTLDVYIKNNPGLEMATASGGRGSVGSIYSTDSEGPATTHIGNMVTPGTDLSSTLGDRKVSYGPSDAFGELSLLYLTPRAASIVSTSSCLLWALDRVTFRSILMETNSRKKLQLEKFLRDVPLFDTLDSTSISKLADALQFRDYRYGERIIQQGERGNEFFLIVEGTTSVRKQRDASAKEEECGTLVTGEYFGELALLNGSLRAASIVAVAPPASSSQQATGKVKLAVLSEQAFKRLVGSLAGTMEAHASTHYYNNGSGSSNEDVSSGLATATNGLDINNGRSRRSIGAGTGQVAGFAASAEDHRFESLVGPRDVNPSLSNARDGFDTGRGRWVGGLGSSPFATSSHPTALTQPDSPRA